MTGAECLAAGAWHDATTRLRIGARRARKRGSARRPRSRRLVAGRCRCGVRVTRAGVQAVSGRRRQAVGRPARGLAGVGLLGVSRRNGGRQRLAAARAAAARRAAADRGAGVARIARESAGPGGGRRPGSRSPACHRSHPRGARRGIDRLRDVGTFAAGPRARGVGRRRGGDARCSTRSTRRSWPES